MQVKKYNGDLVAFDLNRLKQSLAKSGASPEVVARVWESMKPKVYDGITTRNLYKLAFRLLKKQAHSFAARYSLKQALQELGPSGYYFEQWVAKLFEYAGYQTITGQTLSGAAVTHEVDVVALKDDELLAVECKFRNTADAKISVTTPMYFRSRVKDLEDRPFKFFGRTLRISAGWMVTNAFLTTDSIDFAKHYGIQLLAWDYPKNNSIKQRVDHAGLYPITCLTTITKAEKEMLLKRGCMLVKDILHQQNHVEALHCGPRKKSKVIEEAEELVRRISPTPD